MKLSDLQARFQEAIIGEDRAILDAVNPSRRLDRAARFEVYAQAYRLRLAGFLAQDYPASRNALGEATFGALIEAYIEGTLSHHPNARWYARQLPEFMKSAAPWRDRKDRIALVAFERGARRCVRRGQYRSARHRRAGERTYRRVAATALRISGKPRAFGAFARHGRGI